MNTQQILEKLDTVKHGSSVFLDRISWNKLAYHINPNEYPEILCRLGVYIYKVDVSVDLYVIMGGE